MRGHQHPHDESETHWPADFNDDQLVTGSHILKMAPHFGSNSSQPEYGVRYDLNANGVITGGDVLKFSPFFAKSCS